jgi:hypothetical protein
MTRIELLLLPHRALYPSPSSSSPIFSRLFGNIANSGTDQCRGTDCGRYGSHSLRRQRSNLRD